MGHSGFESQFNHYKQVYNSSPYTHPFYTYHSSPATCHLSPVTCHMSLVTYQHILYSEQTRSHIGFLRSIQFYGWVAYTRFHTLVVTRYVSLLSLFLLSLLSFYPLSSTSFHPSSLVSPFSLLQRTPPSRTTYQNSPKSITERQQRATEPSPFTPTSRNAGGTFLLWKPLFPN